MPQIIEDGPGHQQGAEQLFPDSCQLRTHPALHTHGSGLLLCPVVLT